MSESPSWLLMIQVHPVPEDREMGLFSIGVDELAEYFLGDYEIEIASVWAGSIDVISLEDLDTLPETT